MEASIIVDCLMGLFVLALGALFQTLREAGKDQERNHEELRKRVERRDNEIVSEINAVKNKLAGDYVPRDELMRSLESIHEQLRDINDKLSDKVDK